MIGCWTTPTSSSRDAKAVCERYFRELNDTVKPEITRGNLQRQCRAGPLAYPYFLPSNSPNSTSV